MKLLLFIENFLILRTILLLSSVNAWIPIIPRQTHFTSTSEPISITCDNIVKSIPQITNKQCTGSECNNFELVYLILLENAEQQFDNVFDFIKINTRGCTADSLFWFITPQCSQSINGLDCEVKAFKYLYYAMETLKQPNSFSPLSNSTAVSDMYQMLYYAIINASNNFGFIGSSITLITDMSCEEFCSNVLPFYFYQTFSQFGNMGYHMQVYLTGSDSSSGTCAKFFESANVTHKFGLPLVGAESLCLDPPSAVDYCNFTSQKVSTEKPYTNTNNKLIVMGYLLENWDMEYYESFVRQVTGDCTQNDVIQVIYPDKVGPEINITSANMDSLLIPTDIYTFNLPYPYSYQATLSAMIYELNTTALNTNTDYNTYIYIFTDVDCLWFCSLDAVSAGWPPLAPYFASTMTSLYDAGYRIRIFQFPKLFASCGSFPDYWGSTGLPQIQTIPTNPNEIDKYSICLSKRTTRVDYETSTVTVYKTSTNKPFLLATDAPGKMSDWKLVLLIGITCFCLVLLALTVTFGICQRRRRRARKLALSRTTNFASNNTGKYKMNNNYWMLPAENLFLNEADVLGRGAFGCVYKGKYKGNISSLEKNAKLKMSLIPNTDGTYEVAVKRLPSYATEFQRQELVQEIEFMKNLGQHIHVIAMLGYVDHFDDPMIVLEYCENGDLHGYLQHLRRTKTEEELNPNEFLALAWQIIDGLSYLHAHNFVHRDIAARNILLTKNTVVKISDFGLCRHNDSAHYSSKGGKLPLRWMAIESLKFFEFSSKSDIWSYGVTVWELFSLGESPFQTIQGDELASYLEAGNRMELPDLCPSALVSMISQCWESAQEDRPSADELRLKIAELLDESSMYYGYLNFKAKTNTFEEYVELAKQ